MPTNFYRFLEQPVLPSMPDGSFMLLSPTLNSHHGMPRVCRFVTVIKGDMDIDPESALELLGDEAAFSGGPVEASSPSAASSLDQVVGAAAVSPIRSGVRKAGLDGTARRTGDVVKGSEFSAADGTVGTPESEAEDEDEDRPLPSLHSSDEGEDGVDLTLGGITQMVTESEDLLATLDQNIGSVYTAADGDENVGAGAVASSPNGLDGQDGGASSTVDGRTSNEKGAGLDKSTEGEESGKGGAGSSAQRASPSGIGSLFEADAIDDILALGESKGSRQKKLGNAVAAGGDGGKGGGKSASTGHTPAQGAAAAAAILGGAAAVAVQSDGAGPAVETGPVNDPTVDLSAHDGHGNVSLIADGRDSDEDEETKAKKAQAEAEGKAALLMHELLLSTQASLESRVSEAQVQLAQQMVCTNQSSENSCFWRLMLTLLPRKRPIMNY